MKSIFLLITMILAISKACLNAAITVDFQSALEQRQVFDQSLSVVPNDNVVSIGYFSYTDSDVAANAGNLLGLKEHWIQFHGSTPIVDASSIEGGHFFGTGTDSYGTFVGKKIYMLAFLTTDNSAPSGVDWGNVTQYGLYSAGSWTFPTDPGSLTINSSQIDHAYWGSYADSTGFGYLQLGAVPEPAGYAVAAGLGMLFFAFIRKLRARV